MQNRQKPAHSFLNLGICSKNQSIWSYGSAKKDAQEHGCTANMRYAGHSEYTQKLVKTDISVQNNSLKKWIQDKKLMKKWTHEFVNKEQEFLGFGWDRPTDEKTVCCYLQMFSDDSLLKTLIPRCSDDELDEIYTLINRLLQKHLDDGEYHTLFLKEEHEH